MSDEIEVQEALCVEDWHVEAQNGDRQDCKMGKWYTVYDRGDDSVTVFSRFWVAAPKRIFAFRSKP